jgi:hypothetical protein
VPPVVPPERKRRRRTGVVLAAAGGVLAVGLAVTFGRGFLKGLAQAGDPGSSPAPTRSVQGRTSPSASPSPSPSVTVVYSGKKLTLAAPDCGDAYKTWLDLDRPESVSGLSNDHADLVYHPCTGDPGYGSIERADSKVRLGTADPATDSAAACREAARENPVKAQFPAVDIKPGTVWCAITGEGRTAKLTFTKVGAPYGEPYFQLDKNPTLYLTVTLWSAG